MKATINYYRALFRYGPPRTKRFKMPIECPILVLWGKDDKALGHKMTVGMSRYAGDSFEQIDFEQCSHWIQHEYPERVYGHMLEFWKREA